MTEWYLITLGHPRMFPHVPWATSFGTCALEWEAIIARALCSPPLCSSMIVGVGPSAPFHTAQAPVVAVPSRHYEKNRRAGQAPKFSRPPEAELQKMIGAAHATSHFVSAALERPVIARGP